MDLSGKTMEELREMDRENDDRLAKCIDHPAELVAYRRQIRQRIAQLIERERLDGFVIEGRRFLD
jgi:hypothetical protein